LAPGHINVESFLTVYKKKPLCLRALVPLRPLGVFKSLNVQLMKSLLRLLLVALAIMLMSWGFFGHEHVNRLAVFTLPQEMILFYKRNIREIEELSVNPDKRRYAVADEAPRHYIDMDDYGDSAAFILPKYWGDAVQKFGEDSLQAHGIVPWHINRMYFRLRDAFMTDDPDAIIRMSSELGHYIADANVPLHTTSNYNGQKTDQHGIHGLWESRLPELFSGDYDLLSGQAQYIDDVQAAAWNAVFTAHRCVDSVFEFERTASDHHADHKYSFEAKSRQTIKVYSVEFSDTYHKMLQGMVERQMRASIKMIGSLWYTAWVDAGQPDLRKLINYRPTEEEIQKRRKELGEWKEGMLKVRVHEN
jgi:hypothetical protein